MKKFLFTVMLAVVGATQIFAMSDREIRENARFLSDRMAYELNLTPEQYEDCYEINYDFIASIDPVLDDVAYGYQDAIDRYYDYLDWRNDDLRMIMAASQFTRFCALEYFYRPIYTSARRWRFRVFDVYTNWSHFYFGLPHVYHSYHGIHSRLHHSHGYYVGRYHHEIAPRYDRFVGSHRYHDIHRHDFGHDRYERGHRMSPRDERRQGHAARPDYRHNDRGHEARPERRQESHRNHEARPERRQESNRSHEARPERRQESNRSHEARPERRQESTRGGGQSRSEHRQESRGSNDAGQSRSHRR